MAFKFSIPVLYSTANVLPIRIYSQCISDNWMSTTIILLAALCCCAVGCARKAKVATVGLGLGGNTYAPQPGLQSTTYKCFPLCETTFISTSSIILPLFCIMSTTNIKYPPAAHTYHDELAAKPAAVTNSQPRANATMAVGSNNDQARAGKAERIRGGCVPCPVCVESFVCVLLI